jgi:hypothetical protein
VTFGATDAPLKGPELDKFKVAPGDLTSEAVFSGAGNLGDSLERSNPEHLAQMSASRSDQGGM